MKTKRSLLATPVMKASTSNEAHAFTVLELLCVIAIIGILAAILLPTIGQAKARAKRIACVEQLHQTGIAFSSFAHDHDGKFPMAVRAQAGGSLEFVQPAAYGISDSSSFYHFQTLADELRTPRVVVCPADTRLPATNFVALRNQNISYFVGLNAQFGNPDSILAGDRNVTNDYIVAPPCCVLRLDPGGAIRWTRELHVFKGNLLFADGRVEESNNPRLAAAGFKVSTDLMLPTIESGRRPGGPKPVASPTFSAGVASASQGVSGWPSTEKPMLVTASMKASDSKATGNEPAQALIHVPYKIPDALSNPSVWLLPKEQAPDPGFSLFPESVSQLPQMLVRKSVWPLWLLLVLLGAGLLRLSKVR